MRDADNIRDVERAGADWMGFIFHPGSPRFVSTLPSYLPQRSRRVGVFVNADQSTILQKTAEFGLHYIQLHGQESPDYCRKLHLSIPDSVHLIKMVPIAAATDLDITEAYTNIVDIFLFETKLLQSGNYYGGSGQQFNWSILSRYTHNVPFMLTGGIGPEDAERLQCIRHPRFVGIDINSRFETSPGIKTATTIELFISKIKDKS